MCFFKIKTCVCWRVNSTYIKMHGATIKKKRSLSRPDVRKTFSEGDLTVTLGANPETTTYKHFFHKLFKTGKQMLALSRRDVTIQSSNIAGIRLSTVTKLQKTVKMHIHHYSQTVCSRTVMFI